MRKEKVKNEEIVIAVINEGSPNKRTMAIGPNNGGIIAIIKNTLGKAKQIIKTL